MSEIEVAFQHLLLKAKQKFLKRGLTSACLKVLNATTKIKHEQHHFPDQATLIKIFMIISDLFELFCKERTEFADEFLAKTEYDEKLGNLLNHYLITLTQFDLQNHELHQKVTQLVSLVSNGTKKINQVNIDKEFSFFILVALLDDFLSYCEDLIYLNESDLVTLVTGKSI